MLPLILGSSSPRRKEILGYFSLPFQQEDSGFDETQVIYREDPKEFAIEVARHKAKNLVERFPDHVILAADTIVSRFGRIFLKPESIEEAHGMLKELSGKEHKVFTGVCVAFKNKLFFEAEETCVFFHELTDNQIRIYHSHIFPLDKAGGYAIQKGGSLIVKRIDGCYYNVMGLPIHTVQAVLLNAGVDLWDYLKSI